MLKKSTKYLATAFAVASLSTFIIGCGAEEDTTVPTDGEIKMPDGTNDPAGGTEEMPEPSDPNNP
jgi:hypothetical protein